MRLSCPPPDNGANVEEQESKYWRFTPYRLILGFSQVTMVNHLGGPDRRQVRIDGYYYKVALVLVRSGAETSLQNQIGLHRSN